MKVDLWRFGRRMRPVIDGLEDVDEAAVSPVIQLGLNVVDKCGESSYGDVRPSLVG